MTLEEAIKGILDIGFDIRITAVPKQGRGIVRFAGKDFSDMSKLINKMIDAKQSLIEYDEKRKEWMK